MSTASPQRRSSRPRDGEATRAEILRAAQSQFQQRGFDHVSLRDIAAAAGVDVALVHRYFGGKAALFTEALKAAIQDGPVHNWDKARFAARFAAAMADGDFGAQAGAGGFQFLLRAATSPATAPLLGAALQEKFLQPISTWLGGRDAEARARLLTAITIGFLADGLIRRVPLTGDARRAFVSRATAMVEVLLEQ